jgi:hypothetical protein
VVSRARNGLEEQHVKEASEVRRDRYTWLSTHMHAHPVAILLGAYEHDPVTPRVKPSLGGRGGAWVKVALNGIAMYNTEHLTMLMGLIAKQGWEPPTNETDSRDVWELMHLEFGVLYRLARRVARSNPSRALDVLMSEHASSEA